MDVVGAVVAAVEERTPQAMMIRIRRKSPQKPDTEAAAAVAYIESPAAYSFEAYAEQPSSAAICLIAQSQALQKRTSQPRPKAPTPFKTMAETSSVSRAAALSALWFIDCACSHYMIRDRSIFQTFTPFAKPAKMDRVAGHIMAEESGVFN